MRRRGRRVLRRTPPAVWVLALVAAAAGAAAGCRPAGSAGTDLVVAGAFGAAVVVLGAHATWPPLLLGGVVLATAGGRPAVQVTGALVVVVALVLERRGAVEPSAAALLSLVVVQAALRLPVEGPVGTSAALAGLAVGPLAVVGATRLPPVVRRPARRVAVLVLALVVVGGLSAGFAAGRARGALEAAEEQATRGVEAAQRGDVEAAAVAFRAAGASFSRAQASTGAWWAAPGRQVPVVGQQVRTLDALARLGATGSALALDGITEVDVDRLRLVDGTVDPAVVAGYQPALARIERGATGLRDAAGSLDSPWLAGPLRERVSRFRRSAAEAAGSARTATQAAAAAPWLLGGEGRRTYLVAFVTPSEARASGGFMGNFGVLVAEDGRLDLVRTGRDDELDRAGDPATKRITGPPDYLARYGRFDPARTWANLTLSPDFPAVAQAMAELFPQSGGEPVDGVIRMDPQAVAGLLRLTGPVRVEGLPLELDADNVAQYLLAGQYEAFTDQDVRSDLLGDVAEAAFDRLTEGTAPRPAEVAAALGPAVAQGNLALWFRDPAAQAFVTRIGADDALPRPEGDRFGVMTQNASGNKIEAFLQRTVRYHVDLDASTGRTTTTVEVELHNDAPVGGFPPSVIGNLVDLPVGTNRSYLSFFTTQAVVAAQLDGRSLRLHHDREAGYRVASAFVDLPPGATRSITLRLSGTTDLRGGRYRFSYLPQVMVRPDRVQWSLATDPAGRVTSASSEGTPSAAASAQTSRTGHTATERRWPSVGPWSVTVGVERTGDAG